MKIAAQMQNIEAETDLVEKALGLAFLVSALFAEVGCEAVVVGGSEIEFFTDGDYMSGDIDLCFVNGPRPAPRLIAEVMARLGCSHRSVRSFKIAGLFVGVLGEVETLARTPFRRITSGDGRQVLLLAKPEDLLAERLLVAVYPTKSEAALACAKKLAFAGLSGLVEIDWEEARRVAARREYRIEKEFTELLDAVRAQTERPPP